MDGERMARLEERLDNVIDRVDAAAADSKAERKELLELVQSMKTEMTHYKGVVGGIALVFSGVAVALGLFKGWIIGGK